MNTPGSFHLKGLHRAVQNDVVYAISPLELQIDTRGSTKSSRNTQSPSLSPVGGKASPQTPSQTPSQTDTFSHWNPFVTASNQGECLACGYRYTTVDELADHQRIDHGLAEVIF